MWDTLSLLWHHCNTHVCCTDLSLRAVLPVQKSPYGVRWDKLYNGSSDDGRNDLATCSSRQRPTSGRRRNTRWRTQSPKTPPRPPEKELGWQNSMRIFPTLLVVCVEESSDSSFMLIIQRVRTLKRKYRHIDEIIILGCIGTYQNDNFRCS